MPDQIMVTLYAPPGHEPTPEKPLEKNLHRVDVKGWLQMGYLEEPPTLEQMVVQGAMGLPINAATEEQLMQLDGIGPAKASTIIQEILENGPFLNLDNAKERLNFIPWDEHKDLIVF